MPGDAPRSHTTNCLVTRPYMLRASATPTPSRLTSSSYGVLYFGQTGNTFASTGGSQLLFFCLLSWSEHGCVRASQSRDGRDLPPPASCVRHPATQQLQHLQSSKATRERRRRRTTEKIQWAAADVKCCLQRASVGGYWRLDDEGNSMSSCHAQSSDTASIANKLKLLPLMLLLRPLLAVPQPRRFLHRWSPLLPVTQ